MPASSELNDWLLLVITGLKWLHGVKPESAFVSPLSKVQTKAPSPQAGEVNQFSHQCGGFMEEVDWNQKLQARTVGYDGAVVYTAECVNLVRICEALPPVGLGGLVNAADISTGFVREALLDPSLVLEENPQEDVRTKDPMIWTSDADCQKLAVVLVNRNICELIEFDETAQVN